jgi:hypothetical protein
MQLTGERLFRGDNHMLDLERVSLGDLRIRFLRCGLDAVEVSTAERFNGRRLTSIARRFR